MSEYHVPVLLEPVLAHWITRTGSDAVYVDGTLGGGGHAEALLRRTEAKLIGIDRDEQAIEEATARLAPFGLRFANLRGNHADMGELLGSIGISQVDGILLDLGVSSHQFDAPERGFSVHADGPLDMRMDRSQALSARTIVNDYPERLLTKILRDYGEEAFAPRVAREIVRRRPIDTTFALVEAVKAGIPAAARQNKKNEFEKQRE